MEITLHYYHTDVFSSTPLSGNGLTVVFPNTYIPDRTLLEITREFKQFETIFIYPPKRQDIYPARIFTVDEELMFAGHPVIGAGAIVHMLFYPNADTVKLSFELGDRLISLQSSKDKQYYQVTMNQGEAVFQNSVERSLYRKIAEALSIQEHDIHDIWPTEVVSTGLPYLLLPLRNNLANCKITHADFESFLQGFGAKFIYVFDAATLECRTWDNVAHTEDIATGSAAGPLCAYLVKNKFRDVGEEIRIHQGGFLNRPSIIKGMIAQNDGHAEVLITGDVSLFASGTIAL